jgi:hypothetical protein
MIGQSSTYVLLLLLTGLARWGCPGCAVAATADDQQAAARLAGMTFSGIPDLLFMITLQCIMLEATARAGAGAAC